MFQAKISDRDCVTALGTVKDEDVSARFSGSSSSLSPSKRYSKAFQRRQGAPVSKKTSSAAGGNSTGQSRGLKRQPTSQECPEPYPRRPPPVYSPQFVVKHAPKDGSCLFTSVDFCHSNLYSNFPSNKPVTNVQENVQQMRNYCAHWASCNRDKFDDVEKYMREIVKVCSAKHKKFDILNE